MNLYLARVRSGLHFTTITVAAENEVGARAAVLRAYNDNELYAAYNVKHIGTAAPDVKQGVLSLT